MEERKKFFIDVAKIAFSAGVSLITVNSIELISRVAEHLCAGYIEKQNLNSLQRVLSNNPKNLNHDLVKLVIKSVKLAIKNVGYLYKLKLTDKIKRLAVDVYIDSFIEKASSLENSLPYNDKINLSKIIEQANDENSVQKLFKIFELNPDSYVDIHHNDKFSDFFKQNFVPNLQLCFGELLKSEEYRPAFIAYQRDVYATIENKVDLLIKQNGELLTKFNEKGIEIKKENSELERLKIAIKTKNSNSLNIDFYNIFDSYFNELSGKVDLLIDISTAIKDDVSIIRKMTSDFSYELSDNWFSKNRVQVYSLIVILLLIVSGFAYNYCHSPFSVNIKFEILPGLRIKSSYPELTAESKITFFLPTEILEKEINSNKEIILNNLSSKLLNDTIRMILNNKFWRLTDSKIILKNDSFKLYLQPSDVFSEVKGTVKSRDNKELLAGVIVRTEGKYDITEVSGHFRIFIPLNQRSPVYHIRVEKVGYQIFEADYNACDDQEIRLEKLQK